MTTVLTTAATSTHVRYFRGRRARSAFLDGFASSGRCSSDRCPERRAAKPTTQNSRRVGRSANTSAVAVCMSSGSLWLCSAAPLMLVLRLEAGVNEPLNGISWGCLIAYPESARSTRIVFNRCCRQKGSRVRGASDRLAAVVEQCAPPPDGLPIQICGGMIFS